METVELKNQVDFFTGRKIKKPTQKELDTFFNVLVYLNYWEMSKIQEGVISFYNEEGAKYRAACDRLITNTPEKASELFILNEGK